MEIKLSIAIYVDSSAQLKKCVDSIRANQVASQCEILLLDAEGTAKSWKDDPQIRYLTLSGKTKAACYEEARKCAAGEWILFTEASAHFGEKALDQAISCAGLPICEAVGAKVRCWISDKDRLPVEEVKIIALFPIFQQGEEKEKKGWGSLEESGPFDVRFHTAVIPFLLGSLLIRKDLTEEIPFCTASPLEFEAEFLLRLFSKMPFYYYKKEAVFFYTQPREDDVNRCPYAVEKEWYLPSLQNRWIPLLEEYDRAGSVPIWVQIAVLFHIYQKYACNFYERDHQIINREEAFALHRLVSRLLSYIDDKVIFQNYDSSYVLPRYFKIYLYHCKYDVENTRKEEKLPYRMHIHDHQLLLVKKGYSLDEYSLRSRSAYTRIAEEVISLGQAENQETIIRVMSSREGRLEIDGDFTWDLLEDTPFHFFCVAARNEEEAHTAGCVYACPKSDVYPLIKYFNVTLAHRYTFHTSIPLNEIQGKNLYFVFEMQGQRFCTRLKFVRAYSKLIESDFSYWCPEKGVAVSYQSPGFLQVRKLSAWEHVKKEALFMASRLCQKEYRMVSRLYFMLLRFVYYLTLPVYGRKRIWITFDKIYKAGDNGEYIFSYCAGRKDGIHAYYVIDPASFDYPRLKKKYGRKILKKKSFRLRLLSLHSEAVLATHSTVSNYVGFEGWYQPFIRDLWDPKIICIQHGLTIQKIAQYQNRIFDNTELYCLASVYEYTNIHNRMYGFTDEQLRITGLARYDGLHNCDKKQILITPTWRRSLVNQGIASEKKTHNDLFRESAYFKVYNSLINDETLVQCAKKCGYRLIYLLHPAMSAQRDDFDKNPDVEIMQATGDMSYEKILTESSLMVTDYSGVQFDFAYQRKPLVYYHSDDLPAQYESGGLIYETMGFGPICRNHEEVVRTLCAYMEKGCEMEEIYRKRADDFFAFDDFQNCERIYTEVRKFLN